MINKKCQRKEKCPEMEIKVKSKARIFIVARLTKVRSMSFIKCWNNVLSFSKAFLNISGSFCESKQVFNATTIIQFVMRRSKKVF